MCKVLALLGPFESLSDRGDHVDTIAGGSRKDCTAPDFTQAQESLKEMKVLVEV
jgi:hypothetical protein